MHVSKTLLFQRTEPMDSVLYTKVPRCSYFPAGSLFRLRRTSWRWSRRWRGRRSGGQHPRDTWPGLPHILRGSPTRIQYSKVARLLRGIATKIFTQSDLHTYCVRGSTFHRGSWNSIYVQYYYRSYSWISADIRDRNDPVGFQVARISWLLISPVFRWIFHHKFSVVATDHYIFLRRSAI